MLYKLYCKLFKQMDKDGSAGLSEEEFQDLVGVEPDEVQDRFVDAFPDSDAALKAADKDGDGKVTQEELEEVMAKKLGLTPENAKKAASQTSTPTFFSLHDGDSSKSTIVHCFSQAFK